MVYGFMILSKPSAEESRVPVLYNAQIYIWDSIFLSIGARQTGAISQLGNCTSMR